MERCTELHATHTGRCKQGFIDDMRVQLELHYDDVHLEDWRRKESNAEKRMPARKREYKVFSSCSYTHRRSPTSACCCRRGS